MKAVPELDPSRVAVMGHGLAVTPLSWPASGSIPTSRHLRLRLRRRGLRLRAPGAAWGAGIRASSESRIRATPGHGALARPSALRAQQPLLWVARIETPILLITGTKDQGQAEQASAPSIARASRPVCALCAGRTHHSAGRRRAQRMGPDLSLVGSLPVRRLQRHLGRAVVTHGHPEPPSRRRVAAIPPQLQGRLASRPGPRRMMGMRLQADLAPVRVSA